MDFENVTLTGHDGIAVLTIDRPKKLNALNEREDRAKNNGKDQAPLKTLAVIFK